MCAGGRDGDCDLLQQVWGLIDPSCHCQLTVVGVSFFGCGFAVIMITSVTVIAPTKKLGDQPPLRLPQDILGSLLSTLTARLQSYFINKATRTTRSLWQIRSCQSDHDPAD
jgi:hypothetical protein